MNYEQKYKEALERAKKWYNAPNSDKIPTYANRVVEEIFPELNESEDEKIRKAIIYGMETLKDQRKNTFNTIPIDFCINWLKKQGQSKKTSIWKHWKDGIAGNGEGKLTFLIKSGVTYSLSSCLSFECDYIELSELENLMLEKQDNLIDVANKEYWRGYKEGKQETLDKYSELEKQSVQNINIPWHDVSEEPKEQRELFCEWKGYADSIWHDVAFYHPSNKTFWNGEQQIENVTKWAYIDEIIEKQLQSYLKPKFKPGDTIQCVSDETDKRTIAEIDTLYNVYRCENNYPIPFTQENIWKLTSKSKFKVGDWISNGACTWRIDLIEKDLYCSNCGRFTCGGDIKSIDEQYHLWSIEDAKDGDVLATNDGSVFIFKGCLDKKHSNNPFAYCGVDCDDDFYVCSGVSWWTAENAYPATKEQYDFLFQRIKKSGFEWDSNKKKLHKIIEK